MHWPVQACDPQGPETRACKVERRCQATARSPRRPTQPTEERRRAPPQTWLSRYSARNRSWCQSAGLLWSQVGTGLLDDRSRMLKVVGRSGEWMRIEAEASRRVSATTSCTLPNQARRLFGHRM
ncbi:uncharacterized protein K452DRAFT_167174 [Aplosporella prunicola CBS 121167]|uniref:Uncharacterized protein n=1 Tax=Aplosporella prunicola CBS 121167 TaxID=1176127 RepID=A0A6A6BG75_9PEZI|nr:uncharacterized protein K452DRAFT_167174 [Aplosporella prunicola CBS 121167]KAF2143162.1 hypothetical protein K452DRAFT_167174 [Aplosporella prunicola CBS 121167]